MRNFACFFRKFTFFHIFHFFAKSTIFCENLQIFVKIFKVSRKSVNWKGDWTEAFVDFAKTRKKRDAVILGLLDFCENLQIGAQILRAAFSGLRNPWP